MFAFLSTWQKHVDSQYISLEMRKGLVVTCTLAFFNVDYSSLHVQRLLGITRGKTCNPFGAAVMYVPLTAVAIHGHFGNCVLEARSEGLFIWRFLWNHGLVVLLPFIAAATECHRIPAAGKTNETRCRDMGKISSSCLALCRIGCSLTLLCCRCKPQCSRELAGWPTVEVYLGLIVMSIKATCWLLAEILFVFHGMWRVARKGIALLTCTGLYEPASCIARLEYCSCMSRWVGTLSTGLCSRFQ